MITPVKRLDAVEAYCSKAITELRLMTWRFPRRQKYSITYSTVMTHIFFHKFCVRQLLWNSERNSLENRHVYKLSGYITNIAELPTVNIKRKKIKKTLKSYGVRSGVVGWGTAFQAKRWRVRLPMGSMGLFIDLILPISGPDVDQPITEMSTRGISWEVKAAGA